MNRTILGTLVLTLAALAAGCAKTSCDEPAEHPGPQENPS